MNPHHLVLQVRARQRIERSERLIQQQNLRPHRDRTCDAYTLLHAAGDLGRTLVVRVLHVHELQVVQRPIAPLCPAHPAAKHFVDGNADVLPHGQPRQQRVILEHDGPIRARPIYLAVLQ
jgi:hypothetical protein